MLKNLPKSWMEWIRRLFDQSLKSGEVPSRWKEAKVIPLLKAGKDAGEVGSYRPVSLTSCLGKWMERVLAARIRYKLESEGSISKWQAGFRVGRSVDDQLIRLSQQIDDGFQERKKTVLALFDFSRAYDKVWRDGLLLKLQRKGFGRTLVSWLQEWWSQRLAKVEVQGAWSKARRFKQDCRRAQYCPHSFF